MKNIKILCLMFVILLVAGYNQQLLSGQTITLIASNHDPESNNMVTGIFKPWFKMIEQRTGGRVKIEEHYNGELVSLQDAYNAVIQGIVDIAVIRPATMPEQFVLDGIVEAPVYNIVGHRPSRTYNELYQKYPELRAEYSRVQPLLLFCMSPATLGTSKKQVRTLKDNAGLKMITAGPFPSQRAKALGQVPVGCPPPEFYSMLEKGVADGGDVVTLPEMYTNKWKEVIKNITLIPSLRATQAVVMNKQKWESLPADIRKIINDMTPDIVELADKTQAIAYGDAITRLSKEPGITVIKLSSEETEKFVNADKPVRDAFIKSLDAKGLPGTKFNADYLELEKKYSAKKYEIK